MFFFGDPIQMAQFYIDSANADDGPTLPDVHFEQMSPSDQGVAFTYAYRAYRNALSDQAEQQTLDILQQYYDEMFIRYAAARPEFIQAVDNYRHVFLPNYDKDNVNKYRELAGLPALP